MYARRTDANHAEIVRDLRKVFCSVVDLSKVGKGCPDLLVGVQNRTFLVEIKHGKNKLQSVQTEFHELWRGDKIIVGYSFEEIYSKIRELVNKSQ